MTAARNGSIGQLAGRRIVPRRMQDGSAAVRRYRAVSMQLAAHLDDRYVELHVLTGDGELIALACPGDSLIALQKHIEQLTQQCSEIAGWSRLPVRLAMAVDRASVQPVMPLCNAATLSEPMVITRTPRRVASTESGRAQSTPAHDRLYSKGAGCPPSDAPWSRRPPFPPNGRRLLFPR